MGIFPSSSINNNPFQPGRQWLVPVQSGCRGFLPLLLLLAVAACTLLGYAVPAWAAGNEPYQRITSSELKVMMDRQEKDLVIIDSRSPGEYQEAQIRGAVNIPLTTQERSPQALTFAKEAKLVFYCNGFT